MARHQKKKKQDEEKEPAWRTGWNLAGSHQMLRYVSARVYPSVDTNLSGARLAVVDRGGNIRVNVSQRASVTDWQMTFIHLLLHLGYGHHEMPASVDSEAWNLAADIVVREMSYQFRTMPENLPTMRNSILRTDEVERLLGSKQLDEYKHMGHSDIVKDQRKTFGPHLEAAGWQSLLAQGMREMAADAIDEVASQHFDRSEKTKTRAHRLLAWFMANYPLLSSLASGFELVEDEQVCRTMSISIAAVEPSRRRIYLNPGAGLTEEEWRFVIAHEILHVALMHEQRREGRDPYIWNVSCDYLIDNWLVEMKIGHLPTVGVLYDPALAGLSSEEIYARLTTDLRRAKKLRSLRGQGLSDIVYGPEEWWKQNEGVRSDEWVRGALMRGLDLHHRSKMRGTVPAGLLDEIEAICQPPIPWDAQMAEWFQAHFPPRQIARSYARASRRQSATPDIVRPGRMPRDPNAAAYVFAVVIDTSASMSAHDLGQALGSIVSYSGAHEVDGIRVINCDAAAYDEGWLLPEELTGRVELHGGGGTILQPALDLIERLKDLPDDAPVMILTDGLYEDHLRCPREHCYVLPKDGWLLYPTDGPVFRMD